MDELERQLRETLSERTEGLGQPAPLATTTTRRIGRRRRLATGAAVAVVVLVAATTAFALRRPDSGQQVAAGSGPAACYPDGLPRALADEVRRIANGAGPDNGVAPAATFSRMPPTTTPDATWPTVENGYVIELTGLDLSHIEYAMNGEILPPGMPAGTTPPSVRAEFVYDANGHRLGWGSSDQLGGPGQLGPLSEATPISLDPGCNAGDVTATTAPSLGVRTLPAFTGYELTPADSSEIATVLAGLTVGEAQQLAAAAGWTIRVVRIDGIDQNVTADRVANRIDVETTHGLIFGLISVECPPARARAVPC